MSKDRTNLLALATLLVWPLLYTLGAATTFQYADSAEFLTVAASAGVAHPPGYPLYTWLGFLATKLWPGTVPTALALLAAALVWGSLAGIYATLRVLRCHPLAAWMGASVAGSSYHLWKHGTLPEAFALLGCLAAWLCYFACVAGDTDTTIARRRRSWLLYALLAGLASTHHQTIILTAPMGVWLLWSLFRDEETTGGLRLFLVGCGCFLLGLLPYVHLWWRGSASLAGSWGELTSLGDVMGHILRREFGTFQSGINDGARDWWSHSLGYLMKSVSWRGTFPLGIACLWVLGLFFSMAAWRKREGKRLPFVLGGAVLAIGLSWVCAGLLFPMLLKMGTTPIAKSIVARFYLLPDIFLGIFAGLGAAWVLTLAGTRRGQGMLLGVGLLWLVGVAVWQFPKASAHKKQWLEGYTRALLRELPKGALLLEAKNEAVCFGVSYLQQVVGLRPDVQFVCVPLLARRWYVKRLQKRWPSFRYKWRPRRIFTLGLIASYAKQGRHVHVTSLYSRSMQRTFVWLPYGLSWRLLPPKQASPSPMAVFGRVSSRFQKIQKPGPLPHPAHLPWEASVAKRYALPWFYLAAILSRMKQPALAKRSAANAKKWTLPGMGPPPGATQPGVAKP